MGVIRLYMTMSVDGYVAGPRDDAEAPMGVDGFRLFNWLDRRDDPGPSGQVYAESKATRAVISGRRTYELAGHWGGDHHELELLRSLEGQGVLHLRYRVRSAG